jgi:hypothetical protein
MKNGTHIQTCITWAKKLFGIFGAVEIQNLCCYSNSSTWVALRIFDPSLAFFTKRATEEM